MASSDTDQLRSVGNQLGRYVRSQAGNPPSPGALQGVVADLAASLPDLQAPLRDLVCRHTFTALLPHALSVGGSIQRDALIQEISRVYHPDVLIDLEEVLNGFLDASGGIAISLTESMVTPKISNLDVGLGYTPVDSSIPVIAQITPTDSTSTDVGIGPFPNRSSLVVVGIVAAVAVIAGLASSYSGKTCAQLSDELAPLAGDSSEFKGLINENKEKCSKDPRFLVEHAILAENKGEYKQALKLLDKSIAIDPNDPYAHVMVGVVYKDLDNFEKALSAYNRAIEIDPKFPNAAFGKGYSLSQLNRPNEAVTWYTKAIEIDPKNQSAYVGRGVTRGFDLKDYSAGLADLNKAIQLNGSDADAFKQRAFIKTWLNDFAGACVDIKKAKQLGVKEVIDHTGKMVPIDEEIRQICT